jgi:hypothetical protein
MGGPRHDAGTEQVVEHAVASAEVDISKSLDEVSARQAKRARPVKDQSSDGVRVFAVSRL